MNLERRLKRAGRLLDLAVEGHQSVDATRHQRPTRRGAKLAFAVALFLAAVGATVAGWPTDDTTEVGTAPAASAPTDADFVTLTVSAEVEPGEAASVEVVDPRFDSLPTSGTYQVSLILSSPWRDEGDVTTGPWQSSAPIVVGNQEACSTDEPVCNVGEAGLIRHDIGSIVPLFIDAGTLPLGDVTLQTVVRSTTGEQVAVTVTLTVSRAEPPPSHTVFTTTTEP